jgi:hypothetical protein
MHIRGFQTKLWYKKLGKKIPKFKAKLVEFTEEKHKFPRFSQTFVPKKYYKGRGVCMSVCIQWVYVFMYVYDGSSCAMPKNGWIRIIWIPHPCSRPRAKGEKGKGTRGRWGRGSGISRKVVMDDR